LFHADQRRSRLLVTLPAGEINHHWTKGLVTSPDDRTLFVSVGSNSDHGENGIGAETGRAAIWAINTASGAARPASPASR
jgi:glucose/arabinose dehydrogenase